MRLASAGAVVLAAALLAGCASTVDGQGSSRLTAVPSVPGLPTPSVPRFTPGPTSSAPSSAPSTSPVALATPCPHVVYPQAKLSFTCITTGLTASYADTVWPLQEFKYVEPTTGWALEEGAGHWGTADGQSLAAIASQVRQRMIDAGGYGSKPTVSTVANRDLKVAGVPAHLLQTTFKINKAWASTEHTKVRQERLWIVALQVGSNDVSLWFVSLPDLAKSLWPKVPTAIASIRVT